MDSLKKINKNCREYFYDHPKLRIFIEYLLMAIGAFLSSFVYAFGYKAFSNPIVDGKEIGNLVTGGFSGLSQIVVKLFEIFSFPVNTIAPFGNMYWNYLIQSTAYFTLNIPIFFLAFKKIGKKFAVFTALNVGFYFLVVNIIPSKVTNMFYFSNSFNFESDFFARAIFAGICTGLSTAIAYKFGHSAGGVDVISVFLNSKKKDLSLGTATMILNAVIVIIYTVLCIIDNKGNLSSTTMALYSCVYFFTASTVIDLFTSRDKKDQLQIITSNQSMPDVLINYFPHSCTIVQGKGAYSKQDKLVIYTVVSIFEVKKAIKIIQQLDPNAFVSITKVNQVVGKFYIEPRK